MDVLIEECVGNKISGTPITKEETNAIVQGEGEEIVNEGAVQLVVDDDGSILQNVDSAEIEMVEEDTVGQIVQGEDGEYYVVVDDGAPDVELDHLSSIQVVTNEDGSETLVLENDQPVTTATDNSHSTYTTSGEDGQTEMSSSMRRGQMFYADRGDGRYEMVQMLEDDENVAGPRSQQPAGVGAMATADGGDLFSMDGLLDPLPQGIKLRRNRVYGTCRCPECGQSFVNTARLERHLAVHQVFGSFLCPLCGKTYKYEYNLFYHWRRTCRDLNGLLGLEERRTMDVGALRQVVEEVAQKKADIGPIDIGINRRVLYATTPLDKLELPTTISGRRGNACRCCGVMILPTHMPRHLDLHRGEGMIDERAAFGGYCCDLCGLLFRQHSNLIKHWRTGCPEIQANIPEDEEIVLDDDGLKRMVMRLMKRPVTQEALVEAIRECDIALSRALTQKVTPLKDGRTQNTDPKTPFAPHDTTGGRGMQQASSGSGNMIARARDAAAKEDDEFFGGIEERWAVEPGVVYADDYTEEEEVAMMGDEGAFGSSSLGGTANRNKWSMTGGPVQCPECFRTFANSGRLERHMAGFHASFGTHHCILCGNRFKYDYNLLYHYRRSCPYTKAFIDRDMREQLDATNLRKLVRTLSQKDLQLAPSLLPPMRLPRRDPADAIGCRRQMLRYPTPVNQPPPQLLVPRPGLQDAKSCPVCSVIFYGSAVVERHMKAAHPLEWECTLNGTNSADESDRRAVIFYGSAVVERHMKAAHPLEWECTLNGTNSADESDRRGDDELSQYEVEEVEPPPTLTAEPPVQQPVVQNEPIVRRAHHIEVDDEGNQKLVDENGIVIEAAEGEEVHVEMDDLGDVQRLIDSGQLQVQHGDQIILVEGGDVDDYDEEVGEGATATEYRIVRTEEADIVEDDLAYEESLAQASLKKKHTRPTKLSDKDADDGLEVAAILTEMKENERAAATAQGGGITAIQVVEEDPKNDGIKEGTSVREKRPRSRRTSTNLGDGLASAEVGSNSQMSASPKRRRLATEPSETTATSTSPLRRSPRRYKLAIMERDDDESVHQQKIEQTVDSEMTAQSHGLYELPLTRVKTIMLSSSEQVPISNEGLFAMTKAAELFIGQLAKGAYEKNNKPSCIEYSHLAEYVQENDELEFLHEMLPRMRRFAEIMHLAPHQATESTELGNK
ncbi:Zinc finger protein sdc-1 [Toxocara canis]|uniref:Zinc finger protein sdc-1 n=1 Tax=Toxocara canis TaxID=6265 RepID=A0A0B2UZK9_TOXCA|nr:Zinc finger protein sdc-1 [Toxocara canis]